MVKANAHAVLLAMARMCMNTKELAKASSVCRNTIYRIKNGYLVRPEYIGRVAKALNVDPETLIISE